MLCCVGSDQLYSLLILGEFGIVYKARLSKGFNKSFSETVAVKTLKGNLDFDWHVHRPSSVVGVKNVVSP